MNRGNWIFTEMVFLAINILITAINGVFLNSRRISITEPSEQVSHVPNHEKFNVMKQSLQLYSDSARFNLEDIQYSRGYSNFANDYLHLKNMNFE